MRTEKQGARAASTVGSGRVWGTASLVVGAVGLICTYAAYDMGMLYVADSMSDFADLSALRDTAVMLGILPMLAVVAGIVAFARRERARRITSTADSVFRNRAMCTTTVA